MQVTPIRTEAHEKAIAPDVLIKVELDDRCYLFPAPRQLTHLQFQVTKAATIRVSGVF